MNRSECISTFPGRRYAKHFTVYATFIISLVGTPSVFGNSLVTIEGGSDGTGQHYSWTVRNHYTSPIVSVEFPHYRADTFTTPKGWTAEATMLVNVGVPDQPGVCKAKAESPLAGIKPDGSAKFEIRMAGGSIQRGAHRGNGEVIVRFADGREEIVANVEVPVSSSTFENFAPILAVVGLVLVWLAVRTVRKKRSKQPDVPVSTSPDAS